MRSGSRCDRLQGVSAHPAQPAMANPWQSVDRRNYLIRRWKKVHAVPKVPPPARIARGTACAPR